MCHRIIHFHTHRRRTLINGVTYIHRPGHLTQYAEDLLGRQTTLAILRVIHSHLHGSITRWPLTKHAGSQHHFRQGLRHIFPGKTHHLTGGGKILRQQYQSGPVRRLRINQQVIEEGRTAETDKAVYMLYVFALTHGTLHRFCHPRSFSLISPLRQQQVKNHQGPVGVGEKLHRHERNHQKADQYDQTTDFKNAARIARGDYRKPVAQLAQSSTAFAATRLDKTGSKQRRQGNRNKEADS